VSATNIETVRPGEEWPNAMRGGSNIPVECEAMESDFVENRVLRLLSSF
jgi:hypothetical protein